jgi:hypothetical protein
MLIILATSEEEIGRTEVSGQPRPKVHETPSQAIRGRYVGICL